MLFRSLLLVLSPLGLLAAGSAWAEWSPEDFSDPAARAGIAAASGGALLPAAAPSGLVQLSALWTAPLPDYAPAFLRSATMGYLVSAFVGVGLILLAVAGLQAIGDRFRRGGSPAAPVETRRGGPHAKSRGMSKTCILRSGRA